METETETSTMVSPCYPFLQENLFNHAVTRLAVSLVDGYGLPMRIDNNVGCPIADCPVDLGPICAFSFPKRVFLLTNC